ncbi:hypothetical protein [uncultured Robinsoniella sp.]|uniref:hypothetical protein n=1 Tax=uncultured Robinsoniella sp. TaxID=904190 RepID=UPI00374EB123
MKIIKKIICLTCFLCTILLVTTIDADARTNVPTQNMKYNPTVITPITTKTTKIKVYVYSNTKLYIKKGNKTLASKSFKKEGIKTIRIKKQKLNSKIKFYLVNMANGKKGKIVTKKVVNKADNIILKAPKVIYESGVLTVRGKIGCVVYIKVVHNEGSDPWYKFGTILSKKGIEATPSFSTDTHGYCLVRLKDTTGKKSPITKVRIPKNDIGAVID